MNPATFLRRPTCVALLSLGLASTAIAQTGSTVDRSTSPPSASTAASAGAKTGAIAEQDREFVTKAAIGGMAEVTLGQLAQSKASSDQVKQFGQKMVDDHGKANTELMTIAKGKGLAVPQELDDKHKSMRMKLEQLSGAEFDREYMKAMVADHKKTISLFEKQAEAGKDPDLKAFAKKSLPILQEHLKMAQATQDRVAAAGRDGSSKSGS